MSFKTLQNYYLIIGVRMKYSKFNLKLKYKNRYYIYNTLTTNLVELAKCDYNNVSKSQKNIDGDEKERLLKNGIFVDDKTDEILNICRNYKKNQDDGDKLIVTIVTTLKCNFKCPYCYENKSSEQSLNDESIEVIKKFLENQLSSKKFKYLLLTWFGGEPLLMLKEISKLSAIVTQICNRYNVKLLSFMSTNGYLINDNNIKMLKDLNLNNLYISIDGDEKYHDSTRILASGKPTFMTIMNNLHILQTNKIPYTIRINITKENSESINSLMDKFKKFNVSPRQVYLGHIQDYTENCLKQESLYLSKQEFAKIQCKFECKMNNNFNFFGLKNIHCRAVYKHNYVIAPDLKVYKCENDIGNVSRCTGLINSKGEYQENAKNAYDQWTPLKNEKCLSCKFLPCCLGGCPYTGLKGAQNNCFSKKYNYKEYLRHIIDNNEIFS